MLKGIGILCMLLGTTGLGLSFARELSLRVEELRALQRLILLLAGELRYARSALPEALARLGERSGEPFRGFLLETAGELRARSGATVQEIWERSLAACKSRLHLTEGEYRELLELGAVLGSPDAKLQLDALDAYRERLELSAAEAEAARKERQRLYRYLGALGGVLLAVLVV